MARNQPLTTPTPDELTARMIGIGLNFEGLPAKNVDIESTLLFASEAGMLHDDYRVLSVLTTWFGVHHAHVNADRLVRLVLAHSDERVRAYWAALATWQKKDRRFARLLNGWRNKRLDLFAEGTEFQIKRRGEDERFAKSPLRVPAGTLRDRDADVLSPEELVRHHAGYRNRVLMGPTFRADVWTVLTQASELSVAEVARRASCSFATAWQASQDFKLLTHAPLSEASTHPQKGRVR